MRTTLINYTNRWFMPLIVSHLPGTVQSGCVDFSEKGISTSLRMGFSIEIEIALDSPMRYASSTSAS